MALEKSGYKAAAQGTTKVNVGIDADGYITPEGAPSVGNKRISINKVAAENGLIDNTEVLEFFIDMANGVQDSNTNVMSVTWGV